MPYLEVLDFVNCLQQVIGLIGGEGACWHLFSDKIRRLASDHPVPVELNQVFDGNTV